MNGEATVHDFVVDGFLRPGFAARAGAKDFSVTSETLFASQWLPLRCYFAAIAIFCNLAPIVTSPLNICFGIRGTRHDGEITAANRTAGWSGY